MSFATDLHHQILQQMVGVHGGVIKAGDNVGAMGMADTQYIIPKMLGSVYLRI